MSREALTTEWLDLLTAGFLAGGCRREDARRLATLVLAQVTGLLLDFAATGDSGRVARAYQDFVGWLANSPELAGSADRAGSPVAADQPPAVVNALGTSRPLLGLRGY